MQVKKFEAKTMKEALELVKVHLGPEAIILSAKDTHRGFGLMGEKSVEVTAAVSEETLRRKKIAEAKLREDLKQRFQQIPASRQKQFINKVFQEQTQERRQPVSASAADISQEVRAQLKGMRYIDIEDEVAAPVQRPQSAAPTPKPMARVPVAKAYPSRSARVSAAAAAAASAAKETFSSPPAQVSVAAVHQMMQETKSNEVIALESQVRELKALVERFQHIPQVPLSMHPGADQGLGYEMSAAYQRLTGHGVQPQIATAMLKKAQKEMPPEAMKKPALIDAWIVRHILDTVDVAGQPSSARYHVFVGSTGQGKTTSLVKFASQLVLKEKRTIAIVSIDTLKLGAADQLRLYAQILNVPFAILRGPEEWAVAEQKLGKVQHILVDGPGLSLRTQDEVDWLRRMLPPANFSKTIHFVQSILARDEETAEIAGRYRGLGFDDVIFTRLDESSRQGPMINFQERFKVPLHSFSFGPRIPEDYEFATKERVVDFLYKLSKVTRREESL